MALVISAVAAYYSIVGLTAIFSAAVLPIIIMGGALEVGKVTAAVWLKMHWSRASITYKLYLVPAVAFLMLLTSMGIFGFLSKAHSDQSLVSGDSMAKVAIYDEKIKTERENIDANRKALKQLDEAVDQVMGRSTDEKGADKAVAIRRGQQAERGRLLKEIEQSQKRIATFNEERAPIAAEFRKVEAEVGPIKYIAALVYGDNPDASILEKAVRLVIIIIVAVFDPLALVLILAAQQSLRWAKEDKVLEPDVLEEKPNYEPDDSPLSEDQIEQIQASAEPEKTWFEKYPYLAKPFVHFTGVKPLVYHPEEPPKPEDPHPVGWMFPKGDVKEEPKAEPDLTVYNDERLVSNFDKEALQEDAPPADASSEQTIGEKKSRWIPPVKEIYVPPETMEPPPKEVLQVAEAADVRKNKKAAQVDDSQGVKAHFGTEFPVNPEKGEMYLRVDKLPSRLYKYNGTGWIEVDKSLTDSYLYNDEYLKHLVAQIEQGQLDIDDLTDSERGQIEEYLLNNAKPNSDTTRNS